MSENKSLYIKNLITKLGFKPKDGKVAVYHKLYNGYELKINYNEKEPLKSTVDYGSKIKRDGDNTCSFSQPESLVVLECVNRLLDKGYSPKNIILEKSWPAGHGVSKRLDICVTRDNGSEYLLIECKTYGKEFDKAYGRIMKDGGQLFTYFKFSNKADVIMLYASELSQKGAINYKNEIIKIEDDYRMGDVKDFYDKWNKLTKDNGIFEDWVNAYDFSSKALTPRHLKPIEQEDSGFIFNRFLEILRNNVVSDKGNAFNKIFTLFLCKVYDEKSTKPNDELGFQWIEGQDDDVSFQLRLTELYRKGMLEFLEKEVTDFNEDEFNKKYKHLGAKDKKALLDEMHRLRLEKNNEFAIKEVFDHQSFKENAKVVKQVVELLQGYRIRYNKRQQYLSDFFELLLTTGLKQEAGQFFTPVPIAQFIIKSLPMEKIVNEKLECGDRNNLLPFIIDYAAGSGHFLTESMHEIQRILDKKNSKDYISDTAKKIRSWQDDHFEWATQYVYGIEKDYRLVKVGKVGCYLHGDGLANVILSDGLGNFKKTKEYRGLLKKVDSDFPMENKQFDIVLSNPPYSVPAFRLNAREYYTEEDFDLYKYLTDQGAQIETLFVERTKQLLKDGGVAGIILPSSMLSNEGIYTKTREIILQYFDIVAITELGSNTFMATGTNTVVLFLRRRNNYDFANIQKSVTKFMASLRDVTINGIEKPVSKYASHVWGDISYEDYISLLSKKPNSTVQKHDIYKDYFAKFKKAKEALVLDYIVSQENEKLCYFISAYNQSVVLVKTGDRDSEKQFLGYTFSNSRGREGIHSSQKGKDIDQCTKLFDPNVFDNPKKASTYIYKAFKNDFTLPIDSTLTKNISRVNLSDMFTFDRANFNKSLNLNSKSKVTFVTKWDTIQVENVASFQNGLWEGEKGELQIAKVLRNTNFKLNNGKLSYDDIAEIKVEKKQLETRQLKYGDILLEKSGGSDTQAIGRVALFDKKSTDVYSFSNFCSRIRVLDINVLNPLYLWAILHEFYVKGGTISLQNGVRLLNIDLESYGKTKIPLPPIKVQQEIVEEISKLEEESKKINKNISSAKDSIAKLMESYRNMPKEKLENIAIMLKRGKSASYGVSDIQIIKSGQARGIKEFDFSQKHYVDKEFVLDERKLERGDILINSTGVGTAGRVTLFDLNGTFVVDTHITILRLNSEKALPAFVLYSLAQIGFKNIEAMATGQSGQIELSIPIIQNIKIPLPSIAEQKKAIKKIEELEKEINTLKTKLTAIPKQKEFILEKHLK